MMARSSKVEPSAHNRLVVGSSPTGPTSQWETVYCNNHECIGPFRQIIQPDWAESYYMCPKCVKEYQEWYDNDPNA